MAGYILGARKGRPAVRDEDAAPRWSCSTGIKLLGKEGLNGEDQEVIGNGLSGGVVVEPYRCGGIALHVY